MIRIVVFFLLKILVIERNEVICDLSYFKPMTDQCNTTYPVTRDMVFTQNISKLFDTLKEDRNAKCFIHCIFQKLDFVDDKGNVKKKELFENANNVWKQVPLDKKETFLIPDMSPKMKGIVVSFIDYCESKDIVAKESDPCNRFFNFSLCLIDDVTTSNG